MEAPPLEFKEESISRPHSKTIHAVAISPDGSLVATGGSDQLVCVVNAATGEVLYKVQGTAWVHGVAWHADGNRCVATSWDGSLTEIRRTRDQWSHQIVFKHHLDLISCTVGPKGLVAVTAQDNCVLILDSSSKYSVKEKIDFEVIPNRVAFSQDGSLLAVGCEDGKLCIFGRRQSKGNFELFAERQAHRTWILGINFSPVETHMVIAGGDRVATIWDTPESFNKEFSWPAAPSFTLRKHKNRVKGACFSGDGHHVISGSTDKSVCTWRVSDGACVSTFNAQESIYSLAFDSASGRLFAGLEDGQLQVWRCASFRTPNPKAFVDARARLADAQDAIAAQVL